ncbi:MAG: HYR domain-containing protein, partial [Bacteroidota bacterium]
VTVNDTEAPTITCPSNITVSNDPGICGAVVNYVNVPSDNCPGLTVAQTAGLPNGAVFPVGTTTNTFVVTDASNNTATCSFDVTVNDTEAPTINCQMAAGPMNLLNNASFENGTVFNGLGAGTGWTIFGAVFGIDAGIIPPSQDGSFYLKMFGANSGAFQDLPVNAGDNITASVYIQNASFDPMLPGCEGFVKLEYFDANNQLISFTESNRLDATLPQNVWTQVSVTDVAPAGAVTVRYVAIMTCNAGGAVFFDDASLTIGSASMGLVGDVTVANDPGQCGAQLQLATPASADNCGVVFLTNDYNNTANASDFYPVGTTVVTYTVGDAAGNTTSCSITVTVNDTEAPNVVCQNITVQLQPSGDVTITPMMVDGGTSDNCSFTLTAMPLTFDCDNVDQPNNVTLTATDPAGNTATCTAIVTVVDTTGSICCPITLDFEKDAMDNALAAGTLINNQWSADGIVISADNNRNNGPDQAILFNSAAPTGGDPDLGTPNVANGGPGIGGGGASTNFVPEDLILIIAERLTDNNNDGLVDNPDDEARGGSIRFDFTQFAATVDAIKLVDLDDGPWTITVEILGGFTTSFSVNAIGDNATIDYPIGLSNVVALTVEMPKSGGIANLVYCPDGPAVSTCASTLDFNRDGMGNPLQMGVKLNNQWLNQGIRVSADNNQGPDEAITFNSANPTGGDPDLGTPNQAFGGPGIGNAGSPSNRIAEGNLLIIAENVTDNNNDGRVDNPDDDLNGGTVSFEFTQTAFTVDSIVLVDIDENAPAVISVEKLDQSVVTFTVPGGGDNSKTTAAIGVDSVVSVDVSLPGSGAIARIHYCEEGPVIPTPCLAALNFETDGNGNPLQAGTQINNQWANFGVTIQTDNNRNNGPDQAIIFDSSNPTGGDDDLGTPNQQYGGPGIGSGGVTNNIPEGNTLIIAERLTDNNNDGLVDNPDDEARGGSITFTFNPTATVDSVVLIDVDDNTGWSAASCVLNNGQTLNMPIPNMGDNGRIVIPIMQDSVQKLTINLGGSGSIAGLYFCADGPAPSNAKIAEQPVAGGGMGQSAGANLERSGMFTAFPNPFEDQTTVRFELTEADDVTLVVFDMSGKMIATLYEGPVEGGEAVDAVFTPDDVTDGIYLAKLVTTGGLVMTKKLMIRR